MYCLKTKLFRKCHDSNDFSDFDKFYKLNEYIKTKFPFDIDSDDYDDKY